MLILSILSLNSCEKLKPGHTSSTGRLRIDIGLFLQINEIDNPLKSTQQTESFRVSILQVNGTPVLEYARADEMPPIIELETGEYYVEAHSDNNLPAEFENPYYYGISETFTITGNELQTVQVNCTLNNTIVSVQYSQSVLDHFLDFSTLVSSAMGSLVYSSTETRLGYFQTMPLDILANLSYQKPDGTQTSKSLSGSIPDPLPNRHYELVIDATINEGMATFQILLDEVPVPVEVVTITEGSLPQAGEIAFGALLITEIMSNPAALSDTEGEWIEIFNNSSQPVNLQNLVILRDDINSHEIAENITLAPAEYYLLARTELAADVPNRYVYGSDILLPNTGANLAIHNAADASGPGALIFQVNYGDTGFPEGSGTSLSLDPGSFNSADAVLAGSWCLSTSMYNTGDAWTPSTANDLCF